MRALRGPARRQPASRASASCWTPAQRRTVSWSWCRSARLGCPTRGRSRRPDATGRVAWSLWPRWVASRGGWSTSTGRWSQRRPDSPRPEDRPTFLTLETAQYYMAHVVGPIIEREAYFDAITIDRNRLYSQILDNLNKASVVGFGLAEISAAAQGCLDGRSGRGPASMTRLRSARSTSVATAWSTTCWTSRSRWRYSQSISGRSRCVATTSPRRTLHLIVDNVEEDTPVAHDIIYDWLGERAVGPGDLRSGCRIPELPGRRSCERRSACRSLRRARGLRRPRLWCGPGVANLGAAFDRILRPRRRRRC